MHSFDPYGSLSRLDEASIGKQLSKPLVRHKLLQPLPRPAKCAVGDGPVGFLRCAWELSSPLPAGRNNAGACWDVPLGTGRDSPSPLSGLDQAQEQVVASPSRQNRPRSAAERPRTSGGTWIAPPFANVNFAAGLQLRRPGEAAVPTSIWSNPTGKFVLPLQTQTAIRQLAAKSSTETREVFEGMRLSAWIIIPEEESGSSPVLEPLAACCPDQTLAVEPVDILIERGSASGASPASASCPTGSGPPLRFGEAFRLRDVTSGPYLGHSGGDSSSRLRWVRLAPGEDAADNRSLRFVAHGKELGAPLLFGRPLMLQRVPLPAQADADVDSDSSESDSSEDSDSDLEQLKREQRRKRKTQKTSGPFATTSTSSQAAAALDVDCGALLSRHADGGTTFSATFLPIEQDEGGISSEPGEPVLTNSGSCGKISTVRSSSGSEAEEVRAMDTILSELRTELHTESAIEQEQRVALEQTSRRRVELESQIDEGDKLRRVAKEARAARKVRNEGRRQEK